MPAHDIIRPVASSELEPSNPSSGNFVTNAANWVNDVRNGWYNFVDGLRSYFGFGSGGPAAGNSQGATHVGSGIVGVGSQEPLSPENGQAIIDFINGDNTAKADSSGGSAKTAGTISLDDLFGSSAKSVDPVLQSYYNMYMKTGNEAYLEKLLDYNASLASTASAREWQEKMSNTEFQRMMADIKEAGYNPWLALQNGVSGSGGYSTSSAGSPSTTAAAQAVSERNNERNVGAEITGNVIRALAMIALFAIRVPGVKAVR